MRPEIDSPFVFISVVGLSYHSENTQWSPHLPWRGLIMYWLLKSHCWNMTFRVIMIWEYLCKHTITGQNWNGIGPMLVGIRPISGIPVIRTFNKSPIICTAISVKYLKYKSHSSHIAAKHEVGGFSEAQTWRSLAIRVTMLYAFLCYI